MSKKIVIVESDTAFSKKLRDELAKSSFNVVETADGKGAYDLVRREKPDLVVLAVELAQGQSGYLVCGKLKKDDEFKKIPVIIIGKDPEGFEGHKKLKTRAEEYLKKPFDPAALTVKVGVLIGLPNDKPAEDDVVVDDLNLDSLDDPSHPPALAAEPPKPAEEHLDFDSMFNSATESQPGGALQAEAPPLGTGTDVLGDPLANAIPADVVPGEVVSGVDIDVRDDSVRNAPGHAATPPAEVDLDISLEAAPREAPKSVTAPRPAARPPSLVADGEVVSLRGKVSELEEKITLLENQVSERDAELAAARSAGGGAKDTSALKEQLLKKDKDLLKLRAELNEKETELLELKEKEAGFETQVSELTAEQAKRDSQIKALTQRSDLLTAEKKKSDAAIAAAKDEARATATQLSTAQGELDLANEQISDLNRQLDALRQQAEATQREFTSAKSALDADLTTLRNQLSTAQTDLEQAKADHSALRSEHDARVQAHTSEAETLKSRITELDGNNARNEERVVKAYQKIKNDEKLRDKTRKALSVALQLLDENAAANVVDETELRPT